MYIRGHYAPSEGKISEIPAIYQIKKPLRRGFLRSAGGLPYMTGPYPDRLGRQKPGPQSYLDSVTSNVWYS